MRSSMRPIGPATLIAFLAFAPITAAIAEDVQVERGSSGGSQIEPAGAETYAPKEKNLNTVPESSSSVESGPIVDSPFVKQILATRPNEDLVICIAGCFTGRDRIVYAQPSSKSPGQQSMVDVPNTSVAAEATTPTSALHPAIP